MATYKKTSPYYTTKMNNLYLEKLNLRSVPTDKDDVEYVIENQYKYRPDLLAFDFYQDPKLWWVFILRNRSVLKDPIYDFIPGTKIYIPKLESINNTLATVPGN